MTEKKPSSKMVDESGKKAMDNPERPSCGIVMPISEIDGCSSAHWNEVLQILKDALTDVGFDAQLVSDSDDIGVIQKRIVQNLYDFDMIVCDVSAKNANVMFELGLRLAFDKPAVVVKDDVTGYSFDTSPIEYLEYPRDLRFSTITQFKQKLGQKAKATLDASKTPEYTTFLKHFGKFRVTGLDTEEVTEAEFINRQFSALRDQIARIEARLSVAFEEPQRKRNIDSRPAGFPIPLIVRRLDAAVGRRDLAIDQLKDDPDSVYACLFDKYPEIYESFGHAVQYEKSVSRAISTYLAKT